jgi:hypothetical protein
MRKLKLVSTLLASGGLAVSLAGSGGLAEAATPLYSVPCVQGGLATAQAAVAAAAAVSPGVLTAGAFKFSFSPDCTGGFRFVARMIDSRPGKHNRSVVVATQLIVDGAGGTATIDATLRPIGAAILNSNSTNGEQTTLQLIGHQRPAGTQVSAEAIQFLLL